MIGLVRDASTTRPLVGALVTLGPQEDGRTTATDGNGVFRLTAVAVGRYSILIRALGYAPARTSVQISASETVTVNLRRLQNLDTIRVRAMPQAIFGVVGTTDLSPAQGARIEILGTSSGETLSDSTGHFFYPVKSPGPYLVRARAHEMSSTTLAVVVEVDAGVEVALMLITEGDAGKNALEAAFKDFRARMNRRGNGSVLVTGSDLTTHGDAGFMAALLITFGAKVVKVSNRVCVFVDGVPRPGYFPTSLEINDIAMLEAYSTSSERSGTLSAAWPRGAACGDTGLPHLFTPPTNGLNSASSRQPTSDVVRWIAIWLKH